MPPQVDTVILGCKTSCLVEAVQIVVVSVGKEVVLLWDALTGVLPSILKAHLFFSARIRCRAFIIPLMALVNTRSWPVPVMAMERRMSAGAKAYPNDGIRRNLDDSGGRGLHAVSESSCYSPGSGLCLSCCTKLEGPAI